MGFSRAVVLISILVGLAAPIPATASWIVVRGSGLEVITDAGAGAARETLKRFERIRHVFEVRTQRENLTPLPVRVYVFRSAESFRPYQISGFAAGYYQPGRDEDLIAMQSSGNETYRVVQHEFAHLLMRHAGYAVPVWLNEGTAELFSTLSFGRNEARIGDLIESHIVTLRQEPILDLRTLLAVDHQSSHYNERGKSGIFYAQSWALVHMLNFSPEYQKGLANFLSAVMKGEDQTRAFEQCFGKSLNSVLLDLRAYIHRDRFTGIRFAVPKLTDAETRAHEELSSEAANLLLGELMMATGKEDQAETLYAKMLQDSPQSPAVFAALGDLAARRNQDKVAREYYERSMESGSKSGRVRLDYAMVRRQSGEDDASVLPFLREAVALDPKLFEAHHLLGYLSLKLGSYKEAIEHFAQAVALQPGKAAVWEYLALSYHHAGHRDKAIEAARTARANAGSPEEVDRIEATMRAIENGSSLVHSISPKGPSFGPKQHGSKRDEARASSSLPRSSGVLVQIDCLGKLYRMHLISGNQKLLLLVRDPGNVIIRNRGPLEFSCGPTEERNATVEYRPHVNTIYLTQGDVVSIELQ